MRKIISFYFVAAIAQLSAAEWWWEIRIAGQPAGYQHQTTDILAGGAARTTEERAPPKRWLSSSTA